MESANGDTVLGNKINRVPLPQLYLASQSKTSYQSNGISLRLEVGHFHCIFDFSFNLKKDTYAWLKVIFSCLFSYSQRAFKHVIFGSKSVVPTNDRTFPETPTPSPHGQPDPLTPGQMYLNTSTPQATTPSFIAPLSNISEPYNTSFNTSTLSSSSPLPVPVNSTELYTYDTSTLPGLLNSTKDDNSVVITSLVTSFVSNETLGSNESLRGTPGNGIHPPSRGLSRNNIVLITSLSIVIGCFAFTALLLRIGSRVMKAKKEAEERRRRRRHAVRRNQGKRSPQITIKQIRVRIEPDKKGKRTIKGSTKQIRAEPNRLSLRRRQEAETSFITLHDTSRRRTEDALVGIAACSTDVALGKGMVSTLKGESFTSETELLDAFEMDRQKRTHRDNEYDNPIMDAKDPDEEHRSARRTSTETETPFTSDTSNFPSWNNSPLHFISGRTTRRPSSPERTSLPSNTGDVARESSESGSNGDVHRRIKLMRMHGRRNSGNNSKDSGYAGGSFASQDSSRNLLAYLREDQLKREKFNTDVTKEPESTRDATPVILEMENETAPLVRLGRTQSTNLQPSRRFSLQVPQQTSYYHNNVGRTGSHPYFPHHVRPVRRVMGSPITGRRPLYDYYSREPLGHNRYNQQPYIVDCPPLYYEDSYFNFNEQSQQPARSYRNNNPISRLPPQEAQQYSPNLFPSLSSFMTSPPPLHQVAHDDRTRFVKRRTASTQTPTDNSPETPPSSPPSSPSIIRWYREGRSYVLMPRDDMDLDYLGPVYLAESMSESDQSLSEPMETSMASDVHKDLRQEQPSGKGDIDSETESDGTSDSAEGDEGTKVSSKDEDSVKDESALLLGDSSNVCIHDTKL